MSGRKPRNLASASFTLCWLTLSELAAVGMRDGVPANRACATLKPNDLALKAIIARQDDAATVQKREERSAVLSCEETKRRKSFARKCPKSFAADAVIVLIDKPF